MFVLTIKQLTSHVDCREFVGGTHRIWPVPTTVIPKLMCLSLSGCSLSGLSGSYQEVDGEREQKIP